ncbi:MAG: hypothetical protein HQM08_27410 [Candidatus Riflebacteria bacterium]|nr:hypothetical protein [Candidatus Riflebacteria bacterium]
MYIANPIYDSVFKFLLDDNKVAKIILSALIGQKVVELAFKPTEHLERAEEAGVKYTIFRMDFSAKVQIEDGSLNTVIIELQKAKLPDDILRFRRYLASAYKDKENIRKVETEQGKSTSVAIPIIAVYILGHPLKGIEAPVVRIGRSYIDAATGDEIKTKHEFIEGISHNALIIQLPALKQRRRTSLEKLLALFDPSSKKADDEHLLNIKEEDVPLKYRSVFRRLLKAAQTPEIQMQMEDEDEYLESLMNYERALAIQDNLIAEKNKALVAKDKELAESKKMVAEKNNSLAEKINALVEKDKALVAKDKELAENRSIIEALKKKLKTADR